jgi:hypothetical protein
VDADVDRRLDDDPNRARTGAVAGGGRKATALCPAAVAVEDDRNRPGDLGQLDLRQRPDTSERADACEQVHGENWRSERERTEYG